MLSTGLLYLWGKVLKLETKNDSLCESYHINIWDVVENGSYIRHDNNGEPMPRSSWFDEKKHMYLLNSKAKNLLMCALFQEEYKKVHVFKEAKETWDTLVVIYEGASEVKRNKLSLLTREYKIFSMLDNRKFKPCLAGFK